MTDAKLRGSNAEFIDDIADHTVIAVVNLSDDRDWAARETWEIARTIVRAGRRVALVDWHVHAPLLRSHAARKSPVGIVDTLMTGASFDEAVVEQEEEGLFFADVGTRARDPYHIWTHPRWRAIARGFARERGVLVVCMPASALAPSSLVPNGYLLLAPKNYRSPDQYPEVGLWARQGVECLGVLQPGQVGPLTGEIQRPLPPAASVASTPVPDLVSPEQTERVASALGVSSADTKPVLATASLFQGSIARAPRVSPFIWVGLVPLIGALGWLLWPRIDSAPAPEPAPTATTADGRLAPPAEPDTLFFSLQVAAYSEAEPALALAMRLERPDFSATVSAVTSAGDRQWFRVLIGQFINASEADSTLADLWRRGLVGTGQGTILRTPHTLRLRQGLTRQEAMDAARQLRSEAIPAYVLMTPVGASVAVGAFERPDQAATTLRMLESRGLDASVTLRLGTTP